MLPNLLKVFCNQIERESNAIKMAIRDYHLYRAICLTNPAVAGQFSIDEAGILIGSFSYASDTSVLFSRMFARRIKKLQTWQNKANQEFTQLYYAVDLATI